MKRHLLIMLAVVISLIVLASSLVAWPFLERALLVKIEQGLSKAADRRYTDPRPVPAGEKVGSPPSGSSESGKIRAGTGMPYKTTGLEGYERMPSSRPGSNRNHFAL